LIHQSHLVILNKRVSHAIGKWVELLYILALLFDRRRLLFGEKKLFHLQRIGDGNFKGGSRIEQ